MTPDKVRAQVREFIEPRLGGRSLQDDDDIFALGYVNSLFAMQLARFVETQFGVTLAGNDLDFESFRRVNGIVDLVEAVSIDVQVDSGS